MDTKGGVMMASGGGGGRSNDHGARVQAEMDRVKQLPRSSLYAAHRQKVLQKVLDLLKIPKQDRSCNEVEELERLFTELAF